MRRADFAVGFLIIGLSGFVIWATSGLTYLQRIIPGPGFMPYWVAVIGIIFGGLLLLVTLLTREDGRLTWPEPRVALRNFVAFVALCLVPLSSEYIGFLSAAVLFMLFSLLVVLRKPLLPTLLSVAVIGALVHFLFNVWLSVRLPTGPFGF
jgi:putative tricarboxylic transport membrane protein